MGIARSLGYAAALTAALTGCGENRSDPAPTPDQSVQKYEFDALAARVEALEKAQPSPDMDLKLGDKGFTTIESQYGTLTIEMIAVKPEGSGSRVTFKIGNPLNATISDVTIFAGWGKLNEKGEPLNAQAYKELRIDGALRPGAWTEKTAIIDGVKPTDLGFIRALHISGGTISLAR